jgi:hypothetical protein
LSVVWHWNTRERRPFWLALLALRTRQQDGDAEEGEASATSDHTTGPSSQTASSAGPSGGQDATFDAFFAQYERPLYGYTKPAATSAAGVSTSQGSRHA